MIAPTNAAADITSTISAEERNKYPPRGGAPSGKRPVVISGGNVDPAVFARALA